MNVNNRPAPRSPAASRPSPASGRGYAVKECFLTLQGEGVQAGSRAVFLSLALALAEASGARDIFVGVNALDYSGYPDCRPEFISEFERLANLATKAGVEGEKIVIHAPLQEMTKAEIAREAERLGLDAALSHSCYDPDSQGRACGRCDACRLRAKGFAEAGLPDPTVYA